MKEKNNEFSSVEKKLWKKNPEQFRRFSSQGQPTHTPNTHKTQKKKMYLLVFMVICVLQLSECQTNFYGTAELVKPARRSRLLSDFVDANKKQDSATTISAYANPDLASIETELSDDDGPTPTVDTLRKYARIFKMDTDNLNDKQRMLLQRIVQRIARLNGAESDEETMDMGDNEGRARRKHRDDRKKANNKKSSSTTARPSGGTLKSTTKSATLTTRPKKKIAAGGSTTSTTQTTANGSESLHSIEATSPTKVGKMKVTQANDITLTSANGVDLGNISTTSIVNILSTVDNARESFYVRRPSPATVTAVHSKVPHHKVS